MLILSKRNSIYIQLLRLLLISAVLAASFFLVIDKVSEYCIEYYLENTDYIEKENQKYLDRLQKYITDQQIASTDRKAISSWVKKQQLVSLRIYKNNLQIFDSDYPDQNVSDEEITAGNYEWESYKELKYTDGTAEVVISGAYGYRLYSYGTLFEICLSFVFFLFLVLMGIRKKMWYILKLSDEIEILEGGSLDYQVTIQGNDELTALAEGLNNMRISFQNLLKRESEIVHENQRVVTEMSHDLRTPVTSILLYTEILRKGKYKSEEQRIDYINKIDQKAHRMKQLTDHLFEYSLIAGEEQVELEAPELYEVIFYDLFSETCNYLNQKGFQTDFHVQWNGSKICVVTNYIMRVMDNITSNIIKYADKAYPITIRSVEEKGMIGVVFENHKQLLQERVESTGIGLQNIKNMMQRMGALCKVEENEELFRLTLLFHCHNE